MKYDEVLSVFYHQYYENQVNTNNIDIIIVILVLKTLVLQK